MDNKIYDLIIIGSGPAGLTAAIYATRGELNTLVIAGFVPMGQLMTTTDVENFPGFVNGIKGPELMNNMLEQAKRFGCNFVFDNVTKVDFKDKVKKLWDTSNNLYQAKSVIIATGASSKKLNIPGEEKFWSKGVSTCATCDGAFFKEKIVAVVGGGDSACEEANFLTRFASKVYLIVRKDVMKASKIMQNRVFANPKIEILWNTEVQELQGENTLEKAILVNNKTNNKVEILINGLFLAIGHTPNTQFLAESIDIDEAGYIVVTNGTNTTSSGVFVAGDVSDHIYRQAITAAGEGCKAAMAAQKYLEEQER